jgi:hypothetical protein
MRITTASSLSLAGFSAALALAACGHNSSPPISQPAPLVQPPVTSDSTSLSPAVTSTPFAYSWRIAGEGKLNGYDNKFKTSNTDVDTKPTASPPTYDGDLRSTDPGARTGGGGQGPIGNTIDGIPCAATMSNTYHVHAFVGFYVNGYEYALPDAIGMDHALGDQYDKYSGWYNQEIYATCFYYVHVHDGSGMVHMESPTSAPITKSLFTLGNLLDIWGVKASTSQFGPYYGTVTAYTSLNSAVVPCYSTTTCEVGANQYKLWTGTLASMPLYSHEAIWIEVGSGNPNAAHLPGISFATKQ